jgi:hypothetical protein
MVGSGTTRRLTEHDEFTVLSTVQFIITVKFTLEDFSYSSTTSATSSFTSKFTTSWNNGGFVSKMKENIVKLAPAVITKFENAGTVETKFGAPMQFLTVPEPTARPTPTPSPTRAPTTGTNLLIELAFVGGVLLTVRFLLLVIFSQQPCQPCTSLRQSLHR